MAKDKDIATLEKMVSLYCKGVHNMPKGELCEDCKAVLAYAIARRERCPYGDNKTFCAYCETKCYKPAIAEKIREIMRYSGKRSIVHCPYLVLCHAIEGLYYKRKQKRTNRKND